MRVAYIANTRLPTEMAHGLQIMKMCEAFSKNGAKVELIVPQRFRISSLGKKDPFEYYKVDKVFKIKKIFSFDLTPLNRFLGPISFLVQALSFSFFVFIYLLFSKSDIIYSRDRFSLFLISLFKRNTVFEIHKIHKRFFRSILKRVKKIIVISRGLKNTLIKQDIKRNKIFIASDAIDLNDFIANKNKEECREMLDLPLNKKLIIYTGHLYKWKDVENLVLASEFLDNDMSIVIVGGIKWYLSNFIKFVKKRGLKNVNILGYQDYFKIPYYLKAADCLVLTGTEKFKISKEYTSPMKMFEYMTSKRPILAMSLPSFKEILDDKNSFLVKPDDPRALADGIRKVLNNSVLAERISKQAHKDVQKHTWNNRANQILRFICVE